MKAFSTCLIIIIYSVSTKAQTCNCLENFDYMVKKVSLNYAGFQDKVPSKSQKEFNSFTSRLRKKAALANNVESCFMSLRNWTEYFKDHHLRVQLDWRYRKQNPLLSMELNRKFVKKERNSKIHIPDSSFVELLGDDTVLIRLHSFEFSEKKHIDSLINVASSQFSQRSRWIIDLRGNAGGTDYAFGSLIPYIYTGPMMSRPDEYFSSADNIEVLSENLDSDEVSSESKLFINNLIAQMKATPGAFVNPSGLESIEMKLDKTLTLPKGVAILIDRNTASSAESFLLLAKQSKKVRIYGENSAGMLDYGNTQFFSIPCKDLNLIIPISRSKRLPDYPIDNIGIGPDVRIDTNESDPLKFVLNAEKR